MKTEVIMQRELFGRQIAQKSKSEFFSATDLVRAGNHWRRENKLAPFVLQDWLRLKPIKEFTAELEKKFGTVTSVTRGKYGGTWVHPLLFIDIALAISPRLKIEVYEWMFDHLIKNRNTSGDTYKLMCGALIVRCKNKRNYPKLVKNVARRIKKNCGVTNWQTATEEQLAKRDTIQKEIAWLADSMTNPRIAVRLALRRYK